MSWKRECTRYYLKANAAAQTFQLMHADGSSNAAVPVVDHVVGLAFSYDGEPRAPTLTASGDASYGPAPPALGTQTTAYPAGENCMFRVDEVSGLPVPRLPALAADSALVPLPPRNWSMARGVPTRRTRTAGMPICCASAEWASRFASKPP